MDIFCVYLGCQVYYTNILIVNNVREIKKEKKELG